MARLCTLQEAQTVYTIWDMLDFNLTLEDLTREAEET